jgi:hypothetical protein
MYIETQKQNNCFINALLTNIQNTKSIKHHPLNHDSEVSSSDQWKQAQMKMTSQLLDLSEQTKGMINSKNKALSSLPLFLSSFLSHMIFDFFVFFVLFDCSIYFLYTS